MTVLVIGSTGQLAQHLRELLPEATFWSRVEADLAYPRQLETKVLDARPSFVVNAAAYTAVDRAESEPELAWRVNAEAPTALARAAAKLEIALVHVSTDYVFDGHSESAYRESDSVGPMSIYGTTKLAGELAVRTLCPKHWILRTSWVFSEFGANFVKTMLRLAREREELNVVADQRGRPTYAGDLAAVIAALSRGAPVPFGIHHAVGGPAVSWHEFATRIIRRAHELGMVTKQPLIHPIPTSGYPTPARRPLNSILAPSPTLSTAAQLDWERGLERTLAKLQVV